MPARVRVHGEVCMASLRRVSRSDQTVSIGGIPTAQGRAEILVRAIDSSAPPQFVDARVLVTVQ